MSTVADKKVSLEKPLDERVDEHFRALGLPLHDIQGNK